MSETRFQKMFRGAVDIYGGVRAAGRLLGISPSTVSRLYRGDLADPKTATTLGPAIGVCPCCGQDWPKENKP
jgi:DNA-binding transcriptional regulator YdaS (Cro superfamily)